MGLNEAAEQFVVFIGGRPIAICAVLPQPHPTARRLKRVSRLVVIPDYQGIGVGSRLLGWVARYYYEQKYRFTIVTTTPALIHHFNKSPEWALYRQNRMNPTHTKSSKVDIKRKVSSNRHTTAWEYKRGTFR